MIDINSLPVATPDDVRRVGQYDEDRATVRAFAEALIRWCETGRLEP